MWHELPDGVLQIIAGHMRSQDWAKARGACQAFGQVQPRRLALFLSSMAAVRWCTKLWQQADSIALNMGHLDPGSEELCQILERGARSLQGTRLAELCIQGMEVASLGDNTQIFEAVWLETVLANACSLQRLVLECGCVTKFPVLSQLRHLVIHVHRGISRQACLTIEGLTSLETISLRYLYMAGMVDTDLPALDLSSCKNLAAVDLQYVVPEELGVPTGCSVRLEYCSDDKPEESLRSLCQVCTDVKSRPRGLADTSEWCGMLCLPWPLLTSLEVDTSNIYDQLGVPLVFEGAMPRLRSLKITSFHLVLRIEAPIKLHQLFIATHRICELAVEDLPLLTEEMAMLTVRPWGGEKSITVHDSGFDELVNAYAVSLSRRGSSVPEKVVQTERNAAISECTCGGACLNCLRKLGKLQSYIE